MKEQQRHNWEQLDLPLTDESREGNRAAQSDDLQGDHQAPRTSAQRVYERAAAKTKGACDEQDQR